jgi:hypothetical protein
MVGAIIGAAAQVGSSIYGAIKSSQANKRAEQLLTNQRDENQKWYETRMAQDYTRRADVQNVLRKQRELFNEQYQKARGANIVAGGTDESLALQQAQANNTMGDTMGDIAAQAEDYKEAVEQQYRETDAQLDQKEIALEQQKAQNIANAAGQMGSAVGGLMMGNIDKDVNTGDSSEVDNSAKIKADATAGTVEDALKDQMIGRVPKITV